MEERDKEGQLLVLWPSSKLHSNSSWCVAFTISCGPHGLGLNPFFETVEIGDPTLYSFMWLISCFSLPSVTLPVSASFPIVDRGDDITVDPTRWPSRTSPEHALWKRFSSAKSLLPSRLFGFQMFEPHTGNTDFRLQGL